MWLNPKTDFVRFTVLHATFPDAPPRTYLEVPAAMKNVASLEDTTEWIKRLNLPGMAPSGGIVSSMTARAFITLEFPRRRLSETGKRLIGTYRDGCPEILMNSVKGPTIALIDKLVEQSNSHKDRRVEEFDFEILDVAGPGITAPGIYAEIVHDSDIASSIERWSKDADGLPGSVIGHALIEVYRDALLPDVRSIIDADGEPEPLEALISNEILGIVKQFVAAT